MLTDVEILAITKTIVDKAKATAHVDQGTLKKSIQGKYLRGTVIFRQMYYGQWNENSQLEKYARELMPNGVPYKIILEDIDGSTYEIGKTKQGRTTHKKSVAVAKKNSSKNVQKMLTRVAENKKKKDGSQKD